MNNDLDPAARPVADPQAVAGRSRRLPAAPFNTGTLLATTALRAATGPKLPPFVGD